MDIVASLKSVEPFRKL